ncbi:cell division cycle protein 27 homolog [Diaphorina citri]|uniref:Cell division cycle protein 27 homolog n=1 Tax=Diaphorina citri TaxID=121845 RepID=A0A3Q0IJT7_DIACI|nr:cell division cycle protein 27 homolog [Diaphorina citri]
MLIQEPVQAAIWHCLDHYDYFDAIFLAERLNAEVESDESTFLLATCYYRAGKPNQAYSLLRRKGSQSQECKFLLAKCCLEFENLSEAETILRGSSSSDEEVHSEQLNIENIVSEYGEHAVFVLRLLSEICYQTERDKVANELNRKILKLNPFIWSSFEMLCNRTELPPPVNPKPSMNHTLSTPLMTNHSVQQNLSTPANNTTDKTDKQLPPIPPCLDPATLFNINQLDNFMYCHSSSAPGVYSCAGAPTAPSGGAPVPQTPMNQASEPPLMGQQLPPDSPLINCTPVQHLNNINTNNHSGSGGGKQFTPDDTAQFKPAPPRVGKQYRTRSGLHTIMSPLNASFGILPLDSSNSFSDTPPPPPYSSSPSPLIINSSGNLPPVTLTDSNEQKPIVKRQIMSKRASNTTPLHGNSQSPQSPLPLPPLLFQDQYVFLAQNALGKIDAALYTFNLALEKDPKNDAQNALGKIDAALYTFNLALEKDPKNPLCKFHRASILFGTGRHAEALQELEELKDIVPKESLVYYLAGKAGDLHLEEEMRDDLDTTDNQDNLFASSPPPSSSSARGSGGITPANTTPANNNNNVSTNSGLSSGFRRDELGEELDDDLDDISGTEVDPQNLCVMTAETSQEIKLSVICSSLSLHFLAI